mmetsp:Transcript_51375/g.160381  ORF Transcript_51375/g.160381 Transcript_51375/m.160381 type:complete len:255 (+) Transcript_51375:291-1055(+)
MVRFHVVSEGAVACTQPDPLVVHRPWRQARAQRHVHVLVSQRLWQVEHVLAAERVHEPFRLDLLASSSQQLCLHVSFCTDPRFHACLNVLLPCHLRHLLLVQFGLQHLSSFPLNFQLLLLRRLSFLSLAAKLLGPLPLALHQRLLDLPIHRPPLVLLQEVHQLLSLHVRVIQTELSSLVGWLVHQHRVVGDVCLLPFSPHLLLGTGLLRVVRLPHGGRRVLHDSRVHQERVPGLHRALKVVVNLRAQALGDLSG